MEKKIQLPKEAQPWTEVEVLFIDGCKVTVRYSRQKNPSAVKVIKETLLAAELLEKSDFLHILLKYEIIMV